MKKLTNRFGTEEVYEISDIESKYDKVLIASAACLSVTSDAWSYTGVYGAENPAKFVSITEFASEYYMDKGEKSFAVIVLGCQVTDLSILNDIRTAEMYKNKYSKADIFMGGCLGQRFDIELPISEDRLFFYEYIIHSRGILLRSYIGYYFRVTNQGLSSKKHSGELREIRINKLNVAADKIKRELDLSPKEYFPFWHQQLIYVSILINASINNVRNLMARNHLMHKIFYTKFDYIFYDEQGKSMRKYICQKCGTGLNLLLKRHFVLYDLYHSIRHIIYKLK